MTKQLRHSEWRGFFFTKHVTVVDLFSTNGENRELILKSVFFQIKKCLQFVMHPLNVIYILENMNILRQR